MRINGVDKSCLISKVPGHRRIVEVSLALTLLIQNPTLVSKITLEHTIDYLDLCVYLDEEDPTSNSMIPCKD